jgi:NADH-quinone oxidoreductase subunit D
LNFTKKNQWLSYNYKNQYNSMESLIKHFKFWSEGFVVDSNIVYKGIESPKGEFGVTLISNNSEKPYKCKVRSPAYHHLQLLPKIAKGHFLADLATLIGTIDIVFGEIDR